MKKIKVIKREVPVKTVGKYDSKSNLIKRSKVTLNCTPQ